MNHFRGLKRAYRKKKEQGVIDYVKWVRIHNMALLKKYGNAEQNKRGVAELDEGLMNIINGGAKNLWKSLLAFMLSFYYAFIVNEEDEEI